MTDDTKQPYTPMEAKLRPGDIGVVQHNDQPADHIFRTPTRVAFRIAENKIASRGIVNVHVDEDRGVLVVTCGAGRMRIEPRAGNAIEIGIDYEAQDAASNRACTRKEIDRG